MLQPLASLPVDRDAFERGDQLEVSHPRGRDTVFPPAMDGRERGLRLATDGRRTAQRIDDIVRDRRHGDLYAVIANSRQAVFCDNRDCDNRSARLHERMGLDEIRTWADAKRGRRKLLAEALGIDQDMISKALSPFPKRRLSAEEMDRARAIVKADLGLDEEDVRTIPLLGEVPAGNWREAVRDPLGRIPAPDASVPPNAYALEPKGDSMDLVAAEGSKIILDPQDTDLYPGRYYVVMNADGEATFKQYKEKPARLIPCSSNPKHREIVLGDGQAYRILARVIGIYSRV